MNLLFTRSMIREQAHSLKSSYVFVGSHLTLDVPASEAPHTTYLLFIFHVTLARERTGNLFKGQSGVGWSKQDS